MTAEQVIKVGSNIKIPDGEINLISLIGGGLFLLFILGVAIWGFFKVHWAYTVLCVLLAVLFGYLMYSGNTTYANNKEKAYQKEVEEWIETTVDPYIEKLPLEKSEIVSLVQTEYGDFNVTFKDSDGEIQEVKAVKVDRTLDEFINSYVKYTKLRTDLGHGVTEGIQTSIVYLPPNMVVPKLTDNEVTE